MSKQKNRYLSNIIVSIILVALGVIFLIPQMNELMIDASGTSITPDSELFYSSQRLAEISDMYTTEGVKTYVFTRFTLDLLWPAMYFIFFMSLLRPCILEAPKKIRPYLILLPLITMISDILENIMCSLYMTILDSQVTATIASVVSQIKWLLIGLLVLCLIILYIKLAVKKIKEKRDA